MVYSNPRKRLFRVQSPDSGLHTHHRILREPPPCGPILVNTRLTRRAGLRRSRPWYELKRDAGPSPGLRGKNGTCSEKNDKKGPKTVRFLLGTISQFFRDFRGFPKIQVENHE